MNNVSDPQTPVKQERSMHVAIAILVGQLVVNLPVMLIILGVFGVGIVIILVLEASFPLLPSWSFLLGALASIIIGSLIGCYGGLFQFRVGENGHSKTVRQKINFRNGLLPLA